MYAMFNGQPIFGSRGPAGPDGNPIGTIISYMGTKVPTDYLICDGSVYNISDYSKLAEFFKTQFGSKSYFGGDGTATFAVPDMRNIFLRGYHGASEEQLSGNIGVRQEATQMPYIRSNSISNINVDLLAPVNTGPYIGGKYTDSVSDGIYDNHFFRSTELATAGDFSTPAWYTSRPVNMAVLYCIKATETEGAKPVSEIVVLSASGWIGGTQTVRVPGVFSDEAAQLIQPVPATSSQSAYYAAGIKCTGQAANSLTFTADIPPTEDLTVYVVIQEVVI